MARYKKTLRRYHAWLMQKIAKEVIVCIGDSHIKVFRDKSWKKHFPGRFFDIISVVGATATGLNNPRSKTQAYPVFKKAMLNRPDNTRVLVQLGEVDTGFVIWWRAEKHQTDVQDMLDQGIQVYQQFLDEIALNKRLIVISCPLPTIKDDCKNGEVAKIRGSINATQLERTQLAIKFNQRIHDFCDQRGWQYIDLDPESLDASTGLVKDSLLSRDDADHHYDREAYVELLLPYVDRTING